MHIPYYVKEYRDTHFMQLKHNQERLEKLRQKASRRK
jgi:hypothetical protein